MITDITPFPSTHSRRAISLPTDVLSIQRLNMLRPHLLTVVAAAIVLAACTRPADEAKSPAKPAAGAAQPAKSATVATVNGQVLNQELLDVFAQAVMGGSQEPPTDEQKTQMIDQLVNMTLAAQAADKDGLCQGPKVQARLELLAPSAGRGRQREVHQVASGV